MDTRKFDNQGTLVVAHRGLSGLERENTASAFVAAGNRPYYGIETDVYRTNDGHFVINHDGNLQRIAGENLGVEGLSWDSLRKIVLLDTDGTKGRYDLRLANLENYISICKKYEKYCVLELKSIFTQEETDAMIRLIEGLGWLDHVIFISFHYEDLEKVRVTLPEQPCQFLTGENGDGLIARLRDDRMDIDILHTSLTRERVEAMHAAGLKINCWTVDDPERAAELASWGVDFITTNICEGTRGSKQRCAPGFRMIPPDAGTLPLTRAAPGTGAGMQGAAAPCTRKHPPFSSGEGGRGGWGYRQKAEIFGCDRGAVVGVPEGDENRPAPRYPAKSKCFPRNLPKSPCKTGRFVV